MFRGVNNGFHRRLFYCQRLFHIVRNTHVLRRRFQQSLPVCQPVPGLLWHNIRLHFVQVSGQNDRGGGFTFERIVVSMNMNRTKPESYCARMRAICFGSRTRVVGMRGQYPGIPQQLVPPVVRLSRRARVKRRVMQRIYGRQRNQAVKVSLHLCRVSQPKMEAYV